MDIDGWRLLGLDTQDTPVKIDWDGEMPSLRARGYDGGSAVVGSEQLEWLRGQLVDGDTAHQRGMPPALVFMHHPPVSVNNWEDGARFSKNLGQAGAEQILLDLFAATPQIRGVHCGHCHHQFDGMLARRVPSSIGSSAEAPPALGIHTVPSACATQQLQHSPVDGAEVFTTFGEHGELALPGFRVIDGTSGDSTGASSSSVVRIPPADLKSGAAWVVRPRL